SSTSMSELPLGVRSTAMVFLASMLECRPAQCSVFLASPRWPRRHLRRSAGRRLGQTRQLFFYSCQPSLDRRRRGGRGNRQARVAPPPVQADLFRFVDRADEQADLDGQQLDVGEIDLDVACDDESLVEDPVEDVDEAVRSRGTDELWHAVA